MNDSFFKHLLHYADDYQIISTGSQLSKGYKPDVVLQNGNDYIIMECDTGTSRKGYLGGMIKAAKYLSDERKGVVVFVIKEKKNTSINQIYSHLIQYFEWIAPITNLRAVYLISTNEYCSSDTPLKLFDTLFLEHAKIIH